MQQAKRQSTRVIRHRAPRPEFIAAVRYPDGSRDIFHIRNANDLADARELVMLEVGDVRSLVIAPRY